MKNSINRVDDDIIRPPEKNGNKKNHTALREKIIALVGKYPRSAHSLYDACRNNNLSRSQFRELLQEMHDDGDICINANQRVMLPEQPTEAPADNPKPTESVENRTQPANMGVDEILEHSQQRADTQAGDCVYPVKHDAHIDNLPLGIYAVRHSGNKTVLTSDFQRAGFSIMPTNNKGDPIPKYSQYWNTRRKATHWGHNAWRNAYGLQIFTGEASRKSIDGTDYYPACWDIEEGLLKEHPDLFRKIIEWGLAIPDASLIISKSGGLRINAWVSFVREKSEQIVARREWLNPDDPSKTNGITYAEILSGKGLARIDERYLLAKGRIDEFPVLTESEFMQPYEWLAPLDDRIRKSSPTAEAIPALDEGLPDGLTWKQGDKILISTQRYDCEQDHSSNPTCEYRKHNNATITKWCWACNTSWKVVEGNKRSYIAPKRLEINDTAQETYKDNLCPPKSNETSLEDAISDFLQRLKSNTSQTTDIFILKFATGMGKSYGVLTKAREGGKKVIALLFSHALAEEQTNTALMLGYNAHRFKGRSYNFENSQLRALPLQLREQNETLFRDKDVMCPVYDKLEPYQNKRLNPYMMCFNCPLLNTCKSEGYWSQFSELRNADYLSVCLQDILFNPDFWTLLENFLRGSVPFQEPETDEEVAIAAMLGLPTSDTQDTFQPFDFAMIDDYTAAGLYSEVAYTLEEISNLRKAWQGTATGDVLKQVFEAIMILYHPDGTQKSVDILRNLFDSLDDTTKEAVNTNLTKHAYRDEYGDVVPTAPWTALRKTIASLETLTPVWHSKDWTLLHQLETLINHCENTAQAPMFINEDGNITLFIPPQVHPKLKAILLMSATADILSTQNAFRGQNVAFSVSEGKPSHWAKGVKGFQYVNARWTTQSIFEFQKDEDGKTVYDDEGSPIIVGLTPKATDMLQKLTDLARNDSRKCVFISYKEFVEGVIAELPLVKALHEAFDTITHYDIAPGINYDDYKIFITFGYPKVKQNIIKREARKQYAHDPEPLNFDYTTSDEQGEVYTSTHGRYTDPRLENVRQQLTTEKLQQGNGRARHTRWEDTITLTFSAEPIPGFTELATPFTDQDWRNTESFDLDAVIEVRRQAEQEQDAQKATRGHTEAILELHGQGVKPAETAKRLGISKPAVSQATQKARRKDKGRIGKNPNAELKNVARLRREAGERIKEIAECLNRDPRTISKWCEGIKPPSRVERDVLSILSNGKVWKTPDIVVHSRFKHQNVSTALKKLVDADKIARIKRGFYQIKK